jgi:hypothetical protein
MSSQGARRVLLKASEFRVQPDISGLPNSTGLARLRAVQRSWLNSTLRILAIEIYSLGPRILAILGRPKPKCQVRVPMAPMEGFYSFLQDRNFALACSDHIRQQLALCPWLGVVDQERLGLAFRDGAEWVLRSQSTPVCNEVRHP